MPTKKRQASVRHPVAAPTRDRPEVGRLYWHRTLGYRVRVLEASRFGVRYKRADIGAAAGLPMPVFRLHLAAFWEAYE